MSDLIIRKAQPEDAKELIDFYNIVGGESDYLIHGANEFQVPVERVAAYIKATINSTNCLMLVGTIEGTIIARAMIEGYQAKRIRHRGKLAITVKKDHWNQGIGSMMLERLLELAPSLQLQVIELEVLAENERAIALYQKLGFEIFGHYKNYFYVNGEYKDALYMYLNL